MRFTVTGIWHWTRRRPRLGMARARGSASRKSRRSTRTTPGVIERLARSLRSRNGCGSPLSSFTASRRNGSIPYAGPNFDVGLIDAALRQPEPSGPPTVLFIAKEFQRKGEQRLRPLFSDCGQPSPTYVAGSENLPVEFQSLGNVEHLGLLDKTDPVQLQRLLTAYRDADVSILPSRRDPFPYGDSGSDVLRATVRGKQYLGHAGDD